MLFAVPNNHLDHSRIFKKDIGSIAPAGEPVKGSAAEASIAQQVFPLTGC
jgi:hypothetical protein